MGMLEEKDRIQQRRDARDFLIGAGSEILPQATITSGFGMNSHSSQNIMYEFQQNKFVQPVSIPAGNKTIDAWKILPSLKEDKKFEEALPKMIKIEKPKARKSKNK